MSDAEACSRITGTALPPTVHFEPVVANEINGRLVRQINAVAMHTGICAISDWNPALNEEHRAQKQAALSLVWNELIQTLNEVHAHLVEWELSSANANLP